MDKLEKYIVAASFAVVGLLITALVISVTFFHLSLPTCLTNVSGFTKGEVLSFYDPLKFKNRYEVHVVAKMWSFDPSVIEVEEGSDVDLYLTSADVVHGFEVLGTNVNLMAVPGEINYAHLHFDSAGEHSVICHEYCGVGHQGMAAKIVVISSVRKKPKEDSNLAKLDGHEIVQEKGCLGCHSLDGSKIIGPSFRALFGKNEEMENGEHIQVDDAYLHDYILKPNEKVVKGFQPVMPKLAVSEDEIKSIILYLKTLQ